jgi:hypothetical protein
MERAKEMTDRYNSIQMTEMTTSETHQESDQERHSIEIEMRIT